MAPATMVNGRIMCALEKASLHGRMDLTTMALSPKTSLMAMAECTGKQIILNMMVIGKWEYKKAKVSSNTKMAVCMKATGSTTNARVQAL